VKNKFRLQVEM